MKEEEAGVETGGRGRRASEAFEPLLHHQPAKWHSGPDSPNVFIF